MEEFANWDDPTSVDWGNEDAQATQTTQSATTTSEAPVDEQVFKCTACKLQFNPKGICNSRLMCCFDFAPFEKVYSYNAQNPDELTIVENEQLEVVGDGDGDGWLRARNYRGEEGYVPNNYLDVERDIPTDTNANQGKGTLAWNTAV